MKNAIAIRTAAALLLVSIAARGTALAQDGGRTCPDEKASQVPVEIVKGGDYERCGLGIVVFGIGGAILGSKCYEHEVRTPAHQECKGERAVDMSCVKETDLIVECRYCHCGGLIIPGLEIGLPVSCVCTEWYAFGTVEDFQTKACPPAGPQ